ncbi:MAG: LysR family transcriptional regulator [Oscillospiraceae bacterium]|nr:LysR family transcriptional regulator [Oscillospiraceae bacterium]
MEIRNLTTFLKVAALRNFTHAAKALGYSQSNVSAQIAQLEEEIGVPLFNRIGRQVSLTQFGEELLPYAQQLCSIAVKMENLTKTEAFLGGTVRVGLTDSISELLLEDALLAFHKRFPHVQVEISLDTTEMLLERLKKGELDAACVITVPLPATEWTIWAEHLISIVIAANPGLSLCAKSKCTLEELIRQKLVLMETSAPYSLQFEKALAEQHLECRPVFRLQSAQTAVHMIQQGPFATVLPYYAVKAALGDGSAKLVNVPRGRSSRLCRPCCIAAAC